MSGASVSLHRAVTEAQGFKHPSRDETERRQKAWAVAEFQRATGWTQEMLHADVGIIAEAFDHYVHSTPDHSERACPHGTTDLDGQCISLCETRPRLDP